MNKQKEYNIKIYELTNLFDSVLQQDLLVDNFSFTESINAGQGELRLKLALGFESTKIQYNQVLRVYESHAGQAGRCIYTGIIGSLQRIYENGVAYVEVRVIGLASMLTWLYYKDGSNYAFTKNQAANLTLQAVVDYFTTKYPSLISYDGTSIETGPTVNMAFNYTKCFDALKNIADATPSFWWSIDANGKLQYHPKTWSAVQVIHKVNMDLEVERITVDENSERIANNYILKWASGTVTADDTASQTANGLRELREEKTQINDSTTAQNAADDYIANNKDYKRKIRVTVNDQYDIESIHAGHFLTINNSKYPITALQIQRISYNIDKLEIELEEVTSFTQELFT